MQSKLILYEMPLYLNKYDLKKNYVIKVNQKKKIKLTFT